MNTRLITLITAVALVPLALAVTGCAQRDPIKEVAISTIAFDLKRQQVRRAIFTGANRKGWKIEDVDSSHLLATHQRELRMVRIVIEYSPKGYTIRYRDSRNMAHSAKAGTIHPRYYWWLQSLETEINKQLARATR